MLKLQTLKTNKIYFNTIKTASCTHRSPSVQQHGSRNIKAIVMDTVPVTLTAETRLIRVINVLQQRRLCKVQ
jgi:hypothetical protein